MFGYNRLQKKVRLLELENSRIKSTLRQLLDQTDVDILPEIPNEEEMKLRDDLGSYGKVYG